MGLGFGLISAQRTPDDPRTWSDVYDEALRVAGHAERLGFHTVWTTEHHFVDDGYMPSLLTFSAAVAARTERIAIGTGVLLAPLHHPLRIAEDAATVQLISRGRLLLGLGLGWSQIEFDAFDADMGTRGKAMSEILTLLPRAWSGEPFTHDGEVYHFPELAVRPAPEQPIPLIIGGTAEAAVRRAARLGDGFFSNAAPSTFLEQVRVGREALEQAGRDPGSFRWLYYSNLYPGDDDDAAWEEIKASVWLLNWKYADMEASATRSGPLPAPPPLTGDMEQRMRRRAIAGTPQRIIDTLGDLREQAGVPIEFTARSYFPDLPLSRQVEIMERLATDVAPHL
jgi:probable F420-dependent oxidoreductase